MSCFSTQFSDVIDKINSIMSDLQPFSADEDVDYALAYLSRAIVYLQLTDCSRSHGNRAGIQSERTAAPAPL